MPLKGEGGGRVRRLMAKTILDFHFDYLTPSLICPYPFQPPKIKTGKILTCVSPPSTFSRVFLTSHPCSLSLSKIPFYTILSSCIISLSKTHYRLFHYVLFFFLRPKHLCAIFIFTLYMSSTYMNYAGILDFHCC